MKDKEQQFRNVYQASKDKIYRLCLGFMGNVPDAEDLFQEILVKVWKNLDSFREESKISTWVYRIATNTALYQVNKNSKKQNKLLKETINIELEQLGSDSSYTEEDINSLYKAIASLKKIDRVIISLLLDNCTYAEISTITGISISNVGVKINRIKKTLRKKLITNE